MVDELQKNMPDYLMNTNKSLNKEDFRSMQISNRPTLDQSNPTSLTKVGGGPLDY